MTRRQCFTYQDIEYKNNTFLQNLIHIKTILVEYPVNII